VRISKSVDTKGWGRREVFEKTIYMFSMIYALVSVSKVAIKNLMSWENILFLKNTPRTAGEGEKCAKIAAMNGREKETNTRRTNIARLQTAPTFPNESVGGNRVEESRVDGRFMVLKVGVSKI